MPRTDHLALAQFVRQEKDRLNIGSTTELGKFLGLSQRTAWRLITDPPRPRESTLVKLANAFDVPLTLVRELADRPTGEPERFEWPQEFNQLTRRQRDALIEAGRSMLACR